MASQDITPLASRFKEMLSYYKKDPFTFAQEIGDKRSEKIKRILAGDGFPSFDMLLRIKKAFPDLNLNWLVRGTGYMIQSSQKLGGGSVVVKGSADSSIIPLVSLTRKKEYISHHDDPLWVVNEPSAEYSLYNDHTYRDFEIGAHDMEPLLNPGDLARGIWADDYDRLKLGRIYVIVTKNDIIIRRLAEMDSFLTLAPLDDTFKPITVMIEDVLEAWQVVEIRKRTF